MATLAPEIDVSVRFLTQLFGQAAPPHIGFRFWEGSRWPDERPRSATFVLKHPASIRAMFAAGTEKALAEAYLRDDFDIEGDIECAFELAEALRGRARDNWLAGLRLLQLVQSLPDRSNDADARSFGAAPNGRHTLERDRAAVSFHYDLSNEFYHLWLDRRMVYSCAYFERPDLSLDAAQEAKLSLICRKLRLRAGQSLLDIGCGWGGLAVFAARHHGVRVTGITLSERQAEFAEAQVRAAGLTAAVRIELKDYRQLAVSEPFDAIVSVGMSEHVGASHLADYFKTAAQLLRAGGVFLNHAIGEGVCPLHRVGPSFIDDYVFPDSDIPPIPAVLSAAESAGLEVRDVENLREHYALTLRHWVRRLEAAHVAALAFVNEPTYRVWRLYMAGSAYGFARGHLAIYQALLSKPDAAGASHLPLTRSDWYPASRSD